MTDIAAWPTARRCQRGPVTARRWNPQSPALPLEISLPKLSCHVMSSSVQGPVPRARRPSQEQREWGKWRSLLVPTVSQERRGDRSVPIEVRCGVNTPGQLVGNCCLPATGVVSLPLSPSVSPPCKPDKSLWRHSKNSEPLSRSHTHSQELQ